MITALGKLHIQRALESLNAGNDIGSHESIRHAQYIQPQIYSQGSDTARQSASIVTTAQTELQDRLRAHVENKDVNRC